MGKTTLSLYDQLVEVTADLLGPASERFIDRQIKNHLHKNPEDLQPGDMEVLADWFRLSLAMLTDDAKTIRNFIHTVKSLGTQDNGK